MYVEESIPGATPGSAVSVMALTATARDVLEGAFMPLWVRGEVSDFKAHRNGHWYFCLRGEDAQLKCVAWSRERRRIPALTIGASPHACRNALFRDSACSRCCCSAPPS